MPNLYELTLFDGKEVIKKTNKEHSYQEKNTVKSVVINIYSEELINYTFFSLEVNQKSIGKMNEASLRK